MSKLLSHALCASLLSLAAGSAVADGVEACVGIESDAARLACSDGSAGRVAPAVAGPAPAPNVAPASVAHAPTAPATKLTEGWFSDDSFRLAPFAARWDLGAGTDQGDVFEIKPYQAVYLLPVSWRQKVNVDPCSPNPANCATGAGQNYKNVEAKFQISLKTKAWQDMFGSPVDLWLAYTQQSYWQVYDSADSRPFRENNFQPEAWVTMPLTLGPDWLQWRMVNLGAVHQSNGESDPLSRSWNRVYANFGFSSGDMSPRSDD